MPSRIARWTLSRTQRHRSNSDKSAATLAPSTEYSSLTSLPTEMLFAILEVMDDKSLHLMVAVSKRFYHLATQCLLMRYNMSPASGYVTITSSDALRALRIAMTFYSGTFKAVKYLVAAPTSITKDVRRLEALLRRFWLGPTRIHKVSLDFGKNIIDRPVGWTIAGLAPYLLTTVCGQSHTALFVVSNGLFTCKPKTLIRWNPYTRDQYYKMTMHDGSRQWVPSIRSIESLDITYPVCGALGPMSPWTMVVVNARSLHTLLLSIKLSAPEWSAILQSVRLPHLREVGIWAEEISAAVSAAFLNRHPTLTTLKYMSPVAEALHPTEKALALPRLHHLTALAHYVVHTFTTRFGDSLTVSPFPALTHVELFPDARFHDALWLLSLHVPLTQLNLWFLTTAMMPSIFPILSTLESPPTWPIFPRVVSLALNKCDLHTGVARLSAFVAHIFPGLRTLELNHTFSNTVESMRSRIKCTKTLDLSVWTHSNQLLSNT